MNKKHVLLLFLFFVGLPTYAQKNYFEYLTTNDGLSDYSINAFYEDEYARMWVATRNGLNCYDGHSFRLWGQTEGLNDTYVRNVVGDHDGHLLVQTRHDAFLMNLKENKLSPVSRSHISVIAADEQSLWVVSNDTLFRLHITDSLFLTPILSSRGITTVHISSPSRVWVASAEGVWLFKDNKPSSIRFPFIQHVAHLYEDSNHTLWACTRDDGLYHCSTKSTQHYVYEPRNPNSLTDNDVRCITEDRTGCFWIGLYGGLCQLDPKTHTITRYEYDPRAEHALSTFSVWALATDQQGTIWIGTYFGGIDLINPQYSVYTYYGAYGKEGLHLSNPIVTCACADANKNLWIGTNGGGVNYLHRQTNRITSYPLTNENPQFAIKAMWLDEQRERLWVGTHRGGLRWLNIRHPSAGFQTCALPESNIRQLMPLRDSLCVMTQRDIYLVSLQTGEYRRLIPASLMPQITGEWSDMTLHDNTLWFAQTHHLYAFPLQSSAPGLQQWLLPSNIITLFADSLNGLLLGTDSYGVLQKQDSVFVPLTTINERLSSPYIMDISSDQSTYVFATSHNVYLSNIQLDEIHPILPSHQNPLEALVEHSCSIIGTELCAGGINGLAIFPLHEKPVLLTPSSLLVSRQDSSDSPLLTDSLIIIPSKDRILSLRATATGVMTQNDYRLRYRLKPYDKDWIEIPNSATIFYPNLPKGNYTLSVECIGTSLSKNIAIRVLPRWYESQWAWAAYIIVGVLLFYLILICLIRYIEAKTMRQLSTTYQHDLQKATTIVMNHLADPEFNIERFAREMLLSRTGLFTKIQQIAGQTPNEFILGIRMREAATILQTEPKLSINDVSVRVGFNSTSYFIKCFHRYFGNAPTSWRKKG